MRSMTNATVLAGLGILALVIIATIISVSFATRGAMAANRPIVEVLHFVGAGDRYIANRFLRHFLRLGLEGGLIGGGAAMLVFGFSESIAGWFSGTPVGDQFAALLGTLRARVTQVAPSASVDDHRAWIERMRSMTNATVFAGIGILALVIVATIISVSFATRGAMAANRPIVEVLHFVGAGDRFIADRFFRHFLLLGLEGGVIGGGAAMLVFGFSESVAGWFSGTPVGDQFAALLGTFSLRPSGYLVLAVQAVMIAAVTAWASRRTLFATLDDIE